MSVERPQIPNKTFQPDESLRRREANKFAILYILTSGHVPSKNKLDLLSAFTDLTLYQYAGEPDNLADLVSKKIEPSQGDIIKTYWQGETREKLKDIYKKVDDVYPRDKVPDKNSKVRTSLAEWYFTQNYWEAKVRGVATRRDLRHKFFPSSNNPVVAYRESTNLAYVNAMASILDPDMVVNDEEVVKQVFLPILMVYQTVTDFAQSGLPEQGPKWTMDKSNGTDYASLNTLDRISRLVQDCSEYTKPYFDQLKFPQNISRMELRKKIVYCANLLVLAKELYEYQLLRKTSGRYCGTS